LGILDTNGMLARLLATENLLVEHDPQAKTACFNVQTRVMTLPILQTESENINNLFISHECGHALATPDNFPELIPAGVPPSFVNVIEDVRIEKMIQNRYPGLRLDYARGYAQMKEMDFFELEDKDLDEFNLIDRINLHYKLGPTAMVPFSETEMPFVDAAALCVTFEDVIRLAQDVVTFLKAAQSMPNPTTLTPDISAEGGSFTPSDSSESENVEEGDVEEGKDEEKDDGDKAEGDKEDSGASDAPPEQGQDPTGNPLPPEEMKSETQDALNRALNRLIKADTTQITYVRPTNAVFRDSIVPLESIRDSYSVSMNVKPSSIDLNSEAFMKFMSGIKPEVTFMVQQFEMKKSAAAYARASVHKTGVLNTQKLSQYKTHDDIFLRHTVIPEGKNHGIVMLVDWSASMDHIMFPVIKQILTLVQFCRRVQIPFAVYGFTTGGMTTKKSFQTHQEGEVCVSGVKIMELLSSRVKRNDLETDIRALFGWGKTFTDRYSIDASKIYNADLCTGGTPLDSALFLVPSMIEDFKKNTKAEKVSFVCVTDGESGPLGFYKRNQYDTTNKTLLPTTADCNTTIVLRYGAGKTKTLFKLDPYSYYSRTSSGSTAGIVDWLKEMLPSVTFSHIYLGGASQTTTYLKREFDYQDTKFHTEMSKAGSACAFTKKGWPLIVGMNPSLFGDAPEEMECDDGANKADIRKALKKLLKGKSSSKKVLESLVNQFC
jgi:hypothetical protein